MASFKHLVGDFEHICLMHNLRLKTKCSIQLSSSHGLKFPFSSLFQNLGALVSSGVWVARSSGLRIFFQISTENFPSDFDRATFMKGVGAMLSTTEIWNQLDLKACLVPDPRCEGLSFSPDTLPFSLTHKDVISTSQGTLPPSGFPCAFLELVQLNFHFSYPSLCSKEKKCGFADGGNTWVTPANGCLFTHPNQAAITQLLPCKRPFLFSDSHQQPLMQSLVAEMPFVGPLIERATPNQLQNEKKLGFEHLVKLIDAGLRTAICQNIQTSPGVTLSATYSGPNLAEVSPALFKPGYLRAVCEYNDLFETIAHTVFMIYAHSNSVNLRNKIESLRSIAPDECLEDEIMGFRILQTSEEVLTSVMKVRLWRLVVSKLRHRPERIKLGPLDWTEDCFDRNLDAREILEEEFDGAESEGMLNHDTLFEEGWLSIEDDALDNGLFESDELTIPELDDGLFVSDELTMLDWNDGLFESEGPTMLDLENRVSFEDEDYISRDSFTRHVYEPAPYSPVEDILDDNENLLPLDDFFLDHAPNFPANFPANSKYQFGCEEDEMLMEEVVS